MARNDFFYIPPEQCPLPQTNFDDFKLTLTGEEHHHLAKVLRHSAGEKIFATAGDGRIFHCTIDAISSDHTQLRIDNISLDNNEPAFRLTLAQAVPKISRFEWLLEKAVEIGAHEIWPMQTEFTETFFSEKKRLRWKKIMITALKQCGRSRLPRLAPLRSFDEIVAVHNQFEHCWIAHSPIPEPLKYPASPDIIGNKKNGLVLIGPQGGFSEIEIQKAIAAKLDFLSLGPTRLRSETAAIVTAAILLNRYQEEQN